MIKLSEKITAYNVDCMDFMANIPDKFYDIAIVDPPYGIDADIKNSTKTKQSKKSAAKSNDYGGQKWDSQIPNDEYFTEIKRVSKKQIIWGANYYGLKGGYLYWHKNVSMPTYSSGELAWLSFLNKIDFVELTWHGMIQHDMKNKQIRIHPTEKPISLYKWLINKYAKRTDKILDTHGGSFSHAIAAFEMDMYLDICELDKDYFDAAIDRFNKQTLQFKLQQRLEL